MGGGEVTYKKKEERYKHVHEERVRERKTETDRDRHREREKQTENKRVCVRWARVVFFVKQIYLCRRLIMDGDILVREFEL